ncbi:MAG: hypothetical protein U5J99_04610 [Parvularculaceae bacterium]|nr:hypothetical protein [Parvularculaceae bacterium]
MARRLTSLAIAFFFAAAPAVAETLRVMATGLGDGSIAGGAIACNHAGGPVCDAAIATGASVVLTASASPGAIFAGWGGDCPDADPTTSANQCRVDMTAYRSVRARFDPTAAIAPITEAQIADFDDTRSGIGDYLAAHPEINSTAKFIAALPEDYRRNWILMPRSESLQAGTAQAPRLLLPSRLGEFAFAVSLEAGPLQSFPGSHHNAVEFMQWDAARKTFRFHEIAVADVPARDDIDPVAAGLQPRFPARTAPYVSIDDALCAACHSTRNVLNRGTTPGTDGIAHSVPVKMKPNWDAYDNWGGMLSFNRDRIYKGSVEAAAFRALFNLWNWRDNPGARRVVEQLELQPAGVPDGSTLLTRRHNNDYGTVLVNVVADDRITRLSAGGVDDGRIVFGFDDPGPPTVTEPLPAGTMSTTISYAFDRRAGITGTTVFRNDTLVPATPATMPKSDFVTLHHSLSPRSDVGRGVFFLANMSDGPNAERVADEIKTHRFATGGAPTDVRALALAIASRCITATGPADIGATQGISLALLPSVQAFFDARNGMSFNDVYDDTLRRQQSLPLRKADIQKLTLHRAGDHYVYDEDGPSSAPSAEDIDGLIDAYGSATLGIAGGTGGSDISPARLRQEIFRRPIDRGGPDATVMGGALVDRETYVFDVYNNTASIALFRYFLEPLGVAIDKWSTGVRGRSRTYTFSASFGAYSAAIYANGPDSIRASLGLPDIVEDPSAPGDFDPTASCGAILPLAEATFTALPVPDAVPAFTDVQRILNKSCIECHGGLGYPPYRSYGDVINFAENETPAPGERRLWRSLEAVRSLTGAPACPPSSPSCPIGSGTDLSSSYLYQLITDRGNLAHPYNPAEPYDAANPDNPADPDVADERCREGIMPCGGPPLSKADIETVRRWIVGGRPNTEGDPHIRTVDGQRFDFQAAGEFTLLRGEDMELQARQTPVPTAAPLTDPNTGLAACVSVNSAVALRAGRNRVTYQPNLAKGRDTNGPLILRIDGKPVDLASAPFNLSSGGRVIRTSAGGVEVQLPGGTSVVITPARWGAHNIDFMNVDVRHARAIEGVMGAVAAGGWLPALSDGAQLGPRPADANARYAALYGKFADSWRVRAGASLFDYEMGLGPRQFDVKGWPSPRNGVCTAPPTPGLPVGGKPPRPIAEEEAKKLCMAVKDPERRQNCAADVAATGEPAFAEVYLNTEKVALRPMPAAPRLAAPTHNAYVPAGDVKFTWRAPRQTSAQTKAMLCLWSSKELFDMSKCSSAADAQTERRPTEGNQTRVKETAARFKALTRIDSASLAVRKISRGEVYKWKVIVEDETGALSESETRRFEVK